MTAAGDRTGRGGDSAPRHWTALHVKPIIFVVLTLVGVGIYLAFAIPVSVFPETNFPRVVICVDNGVAPIDQMSVTVTRPIEEAVNAVQGLQRILVHHQPGDRRGRPLLLMERGHVPDAAARERRAGAC